jgi:uncharacterized membrane protein YjgN (DUF898 family)
MVRRNFCRRTGQSVLEAAVVLALVAILAISVIKGIGLQSASRLARSNDAFGSQTSGAGSAGRGGVGIAGGGARP